MYVRAADDPFGPPTDRNTYVNVSGLALLTEWMGGLIAHEEMHHLGHNLGPNNDPIMGLAYQTGFTCINT